MYKEVLAFLAQSKIVTTLILHLFVQDAVQSAVEDRSSSDFFILTNGINILFVTHSEEVTTASYFLLTYHPNESLVRSSLTLKLPLQILAANLINKLN